MSKKIAFVFPSVYFGGHEIMAIEIINSLKTCHSVSVLAYINKENISLKNALLKADINYEEYIGYASKMKPVTHFLHVKNSITTIDILQRAALYSSDRNVYLIQGSIELGADFIFWSRMLNISLVSYIPFAHSAIRLKLKFSYIRELISKCYYKMCCNYITISEVFKEQLLSYNKTAVVSICRNFITPERVNEIECSSNSIIKSNIFNIFVVGRVVFSQKGQDIAAEAFVKLLQHYKNCFGKKVHFHFVGDGPDLDSLKKSIYDNTEDSDAFIFHGWAEKWWMVSVEPNLLVIPSHFEGVPLVMLEAIALDIPIVASNADGMVDYLNESALFKLDVEAIVECLFNCLTDPQYLARCRKFKHSEDEHRVDLSAFLGGGSRDREQ